MELTQHVTKLLDAEDFRRLGVRPNECRLTVIRRAAIRSTQTLAQQQLNSPSPQVELQLTRVATSTYRLLDPRKRQDVYQRAYVGRILPNALLLAGRTGFLNGAGGGAATSAGAAFRSQLPSDAELIGTLDLTPGSNRADAWTRSLNSDDLIRSGSYRGRSFWLRRQLSRPLTSFALMLTLVATTFWLAKWSSEQSRLTLRRVHSAIDGSDVQPLDLAVASPDITSMADSTPDTGNVAMQPPRPATDGTEMMSDGDSTSSAVPASVAESVSIQPNEQSVDPPAAAESDRLVDANVPRVSDQPMEATELAPIEIVLLDDPTSIDPPVSEGPTLEAMAMREFNSIFSDVEGYVSALLKSDVWAGGPAPDTGDMAKRDEAESLPAVEMAEVKPQAAAIIEPPASDIARKSPPRYPMPADEELLLARVHWTDREPALGQGINPGEAAALVQRIDDAITNLEIGTAEHFTASLIAAEVAWTFEEFSAVQARLQPLVANYEADLKPLMASSYTGAVELADLPETHEHLLNVGLPLAEQLLLAEMFDSCDAVVFSARRSANALEDETAIGHLDQYTEAVSQMTRLAESLLSVVDEQGELKEGVTDDRIGIAGRYYCLMLRKWKTGLPWLVEASDPRIAGLAERELSLDPEATAEDLSEMAKLWSASASPRTPSRAADSMRLHAIELLRRGLQQTSGLKKIETQRLIEKFEQTLPSFALETEAIETISTAEPMAVAPPTVPASMTQADFGLVGRLRSNGQDVGVRLVYEPGVPMTDVVIEQISERLEQPLETYELEFEGAFELAESATVQVTFAQVAGLTQEIWVDDTLLELDDATSSLEPGRHRIRWAIETAEMSPIFLRVHEMESQREIEIMQPDSPIRDPLPTRLIVKMVRRSQ